MTTRRNAPAFPAVVVRSIRPDPPCTRTAASRWGLCVVFQHTNRYSDRVCVRSRRTAAWPTQRHPQGGSHAPTPVHPRRSALVGRGRPGPAPFHHLPHGHGRRATGAAGQRGPLHRLSRPGGAGARAARFYDRLCPPGRPGGGQAQHRLGPQPGTGGQHPPAGGAHGGRGGASRRCGPGAGLRPDLQRSSRAAMRRAASRRRCRPSATAGR